MDEMKMNVFSSKFDMKYVLEQISNNFEEDKHLLCEISSSFLNDPKNKDPNHLMERNLKEKQNAILKNSKTTYAKLNNICYVKYYLPYSVQPQTINTNSSTTKKNAYNIKQNILRELHLRKRTAKHKIEHFVKRFTGALNNRSVLQKELSIIYKNKSKVKVFIKNQNQKNSTRYRIVIGTPSFFDKYSNLLLEDVMLQNDGHKWNIPWMFIQGDSIVFLKKHED